MRQNIPALTGIRGIAALSVLLFHLPTFGVPVIRNCWLGVDLFFILSGFILTHVHKELKKPTLDRLREFFVLRFFRVYPLHFVVLMATVAMVWIFPAFVGWYRTIPGHANAFSLGGFFQTLTLTNRVGLPEFGLWNAPSWSLSSEVFGYLLFPAFVVASDRLKSRVACYIFAICSLCLFCEMIFRGHMGVARMFFTFPVGIVLARAYQIGPLEPTAAKRLALASCVVVLTCLSIDRIAPFSVFGFAGLIFALASGCGPVETFLSSRLVMWLGQISFSLYLIHHNLFFFVIWYCGTSYWSLAVMILASVGLATLANALIERPSHRLGRRIARREQVAVISAPHSTNAAAVQASVQTAAYD